MAVGGYILYGVVPFTTNGAPLAPDTELLASGELAAVLRPADFERVAMTDAAVADYEKVVEAVFERQTILPAPFGCVFRSTDAVSRWLQMHHLTLAEAIHLVEGRCEVRLHVRLADASRRHEEPDAVATQDATELFRILSREVDSALMLRRPALHAVLSGAFLIDRSGYEEFAAMIGSQQRRYDALRVEHTGPWPPYDFVRMDLGA